MLKTSKWDFAEYLKTEKDIQVCLKTAFEDGDPAVVTAALGAVARARGMSKVAKSSGLNRVSLYRSLSKNGDPSFSTLTKVANSLGYKLAFVPI